MDPQQLRRLLLILIATAALLWFAARELLLLPDGRTHIFFLDVGQGDSALIQSPSGKQILIDGGPNPTVIERLNAVMSFFDRSLDLVILSHPDQDHSGGLPSVLKRYRVGAVVFNGAVAKPDSTYAEILSLAHEKKMPLLLADPTKDIDLGDGVLLDIVWPSPGIAQRPDMKTNDASILIRMLTASNSILFTGDIELKAEREILATGEDLRATILKVPHHGSKTSSSTGFLLAVDPTLAVISVARKNGYGHPHPSVTERYRTFGIPTRLTSQEGTIELILP